MREIKFRVWDGRRINYLNKENDLQIVFGSFNDSWSVWSPYEELVNGDNDELAVLMQYTGLKDKNGTEIYEGDIVKAFNKTYDDTERNNEVVFFNGSFRLKANDDYISDIPLGNYRSKEIEVIGNIYENQELIK